MAVSVPPRHIAGSLQSRQARPLTGKEVADAVERHLLVLSDRMMSEAGLLSDDIASLTYTLKCHIQNQLSSNFRLQRVNITYPKVGWAVKTRLEQLEDESYSINAEVELDLERNVRLNFHFGESGKGNVLKSLEEEKIPTTVPDKTRQQFGLPVEAEYLRPDGTIGKVDLNELKGEKRVARTVDVGSGADNRVAKNIPSDEGGKIGTTEILMTGGEVGNLVVTPDQLPEIDLIATPPDVPKEASSVPLPPPNSMSRTTRPNVKFKGEK
jgi:hypothetical protein